MATKKGMVLEAGDGWAIVLFPGGEYKRIKTREHLQTGQLYQAQGNNIFRYTSAAAIFLIITLASIDFFSVTARANISPGINLGLNRWNRVVSVDTSNTGAKVSINDLNLNGKSLGQAINLILEEHNRNSDLASGDKAPVNHEFSVSLSVKDKKDKQKRDKLLSIIDTTLKDCAAENQGNSSAAKVIRQGNKLTIIDGHTTGQVSHPQSSYDHKSEKTKPQPNKGQDKAHPLLRDQPEKHDPRSGPEDHKLKGNTKELNNNAITPATPQKLEQNNNKNSRDKEKKHPNEHKGNGYVD